MPLVNNVVPQSSQTHRFHISNMAADHVGGGECPVPKTLENGIN